MLTEAYHVLGIEIIACIKGQTQYSLCSIQALEGYNAT